MAAFVFTAGRLHGLVKHPPQNGQYQFHHRVFQFLVHGLRYKLHCKIRHNFGLGYPYFYAFFGAYVRNFITGLPQVSHKQGRVNKKQTPPVWGGVLINYIYLAINLQLHA